MKKKERRNEPKILRCKKVRGLNEPQPTTTIGIASGSMSIQNTITVIVSYYKFLIVFYERMLACELFEF